MGAGVAEILFENGRILTGSGLHPGDADETPRMVEAVAVRGGRVLAVGALADLEPWTGPATKRVDLEGAFAMPGFNDAHVHLGLAGQHRRALDLDGVRSLGAMLETIERYRATAKPGAWLLGGGWNETRWPEGRLPSRDDLDRVTGNAPAILRRVDVHLAVANSAALGAAGVAAGNGDPAGAQIDRDRQGRPTGILREAAAMNLVYAAVPPLTLDERRQGLQLALKEVAANGVTSVQDNSDWEDFPVMQAMRREGAWPVRVAEWMDFSREVEELEERRRSQPADDPYLHLTQLKGFLDGSLGSRTAAMLAPYADDAGNLGLPRYEMDHLLRMTRERLTRSFSIAFHAIGDRANRMALDVFEHSGLASGMGPGDLRCRIEHAQVVAARDVARFARLGVIASVQPCHLLGDMPWAAARLGPDRVRSAYRWQSLARAGARLAFGTDFPVEPIHPMRGLYSTVTRRAIDGSLDFEPKECLSLDEAVLAYTQGAAYAEGREGSKGRLTPGMVADLTVLSRNPFAVEPEELLQIKVLRTVVGGRTVFAADRDPSPEQPGCDVA